MPALTAHAFWHGPAFSILLVAWYRRPGKAWGAVLYTLAGLVVLMSLAGAIAAR